MGIYALLSKIRKPYFVKEAHKVSKKVSIEELKLLYVTIQNALSQEQFFSQESLTLIKFSKQIKIHTYKVSLAINKVGNRNFKQMINRHRVEGSKKILQNPAFSHYTIDAIGHEVGFSNRASFCTAFKKYTKSSPHAYRVDCLKAQTISENH